MQSPARPNPTAATSLQSQSAQRLATVIDDIARCAEQAQRTPQSIRLIAVGKQHPAEKIVALAQHGQRDFAENYLQEACAKIAQVETLLSLDGESGDVESDDGESGNAENAAIANTTITNTTTNTIANQLTWHFIGRIQSRKCREIAQRFDWVHSIAEYKTAQKLNQHRNGAPLNVLIQINLDAEPNKAGVAIDELPTLANQLRELPNLRLRGLMCLPAMREQFTEQRAAFRRCRELLEELNANGFALDQLSMGMSADWRAAIAEGATMLRIGTGLFGERVRLS